MIEIFIFERKVFFFKGRRERDQSEEKKKKKGGRSKGVMEKKLQRRECVDNINYKKNRLRANFQV